MADVIAVSLLFPLFLSSSLSLFHLLKLNFRRVKIRPKFHWKLRFIGTSYRGEAENCKIKVNSCKMYYESLTRCRIALSEDIMANNGRHYAYVAEKSKDPVSLSSSFYRKQFLCTERAWNSSSFLCLYCDLRRNSEMKRMREKQKVSKWGRKRKKR